MFIFSSYYKSYELREKCLKNHYNQKQNVMKNYPLILFGLYMAIFTAPAMSDNHWANPAERYLTAHQAYDQAKCPILKNHIQHFVYFARDRASIHDHPLLKSNRFEGAQIMYPWRSLEPQKGKYDFSTIESDYAYLKQYGKKLSIQLQDASFSPDYVPVPSYLLAQDYGGGATKQINDNDQFEGWVTKRWIPNVQQRFAALLDALGEAFNGKIAVINLQETAIEVSSKTDASFTAERYFESIKTNMTRLKNAFPEQPSTAGSANKRNGVTDIIQYANFMPGEWLPWEDEGYLKGIYQHGENIGVGLGAPDLLMKRKGQLNHALALMHGSKFTVPLAIAVQDGNYIGQTNSDENHSERTNIVPKLHAFAEDFLNVKYMFWANQAPYFKEDVLPCFE